MKIYYLTSTELGQDNVICMATTPQKLIESYTDGEVICETEEEVKNYLESTRRLHMDYKFLND